MGRIEDNGTNRVQQQNQVQQQQQQRQVQNPPPAQPQPQATPNNAANQRSEVQQYGDQQRLRLNNQVNEDQENHSWFAGGVAGSTAAQFDLREQQVRGTTPIRITNNANTPPDFVNNVEADLNRLAPGTTIERPPTNPRDLQIWRQMYGDDTIGVVRPSQNRVAGHETGYRLLDQLSSSPNGRDLLAQQTAPPVYDNSGNRVFGQRYNDNNTVNIQYDPNPMGARAVPHDWSNNSNSFGTPRNAGNGVGSTVYYNPTTPIDLPVVQQNGQIAPQPADPAIILGHELAHANHAQRGTLDPRLGTQGNDHFFREGNQRFQEGDFRGSFLAEEFRTVGFNGNRIGSEPTENSLRRELGIREPRASYLENGIYQNQNPQTGMPVPVNGYQPISTSDAFWGRAGQTAHNTTSAAIDGVRGSRNSALIGGGISGLTSLAQGNDAQTVLTETALGAGSGVAEEVIQRMVNGPTSTTTGMTNNAFRTAASQVRGAAVAGAVINTAFTVHDQWNNLQNDATRSQAVGVIAGEAVVGAASGAAGAYAGAMAGAAIGSIVPGVGTVIGGVVGFAAGAAAGYLADQGLRGLGVDRLVAQGATAAYEGLSSAANTAVEGARSFFSNAASRLSSIFG